MFRWLGFENQSLSVAPVVFALLILCVPLASDLRAQAVCNQPFAVFDGTLYRDKPDLAPYGLRPITIVYSGSIWRPGEDQETLPDPDHIADLAREALTRADTAVLDIEHWPLTGDPQTVEENVAKYRTILQWFREAAPTLRAGYYGNAPIRDYWNAVQGICSSQYGAWQEANDRVAPIARAANVLFPSIYTFYADREGWVNYANGQINEARRYAGGKPVYVFLWPQYHESNPELGGTYLPADYWRLELDTALEHADGIVIWGGWQQTWDDAAPWWQVTREFMQRLQR